MRPSSFRSHVPSMPHRRWALLEHPCSRPTTAWRPRASNTRAWQAQCQVIIGSPKVVDFPTEARLKQLMFRSCSRRLLTRESRYICMSDATEDLTLPAVCYTVEDSKVAGVFVKLTGNMIVLGEV